MGGTNDIPSWLINSMWRPVNGLLHMKVFMAGATKSGFLKSHARTMHVRRLSHNPPAIWETNEMSVCAVAEATCCSPNQIQVFDMKSGVCSTRKRRQTLARVFADKGAITMISAHFRSSMCRTSSPIFFQLDHSSSSVYRMTSLGSDDRSTKCNDALVATARTSAHSEKMRQRLSNFIAATLPEAARRTRGLLGSSIKLSCTGTDVAICFPWTAQLQ